MFGVYFYFERRGVEAGGQLEKYLSFSPFFVPSWEWLFGYGPSMRVFLHVAVFFCCFCFLLSLRYWLLFFAFLLSSPFLHLSTSSLPPPAGALSLAAPLILPSPSSPPSDDALLLAASRRAWLVQ